MGAPLDVGVLCAAQGGNFTSTAVPIQADVDMAKPKAVVITSAVGATPTVTVNIQGSVDGVNYFNIPYAVQGTFTGTYVTTAITITTATTQAYMLQPGWPYQFVQIVASANTNVTLSAKAYT
jgi:hypothetical protein